MKKKYILFFVISMGWFVLSGSLFAEKKELIHWAATLFVFLYGSQWVFSGVFKLTMYAHFGEFEYGNENHKYYRLILFLLGFVLMLFSSIY